MYSILRGLQKGLCLAENVSKKRVNSNFCELSFCQSILRRMLEESNEEKQKVKSASSKKPKSRKADYTKAPDSFLYVLWRCVLSKRKSSRIG